MSEEIKYIPDAEFAAFIKNIPLERKKLTVVNGINMWMVDNVITRPESTRQNV